MVTEAWKRALELRNKALASGSKTDEDAATAAQAAAEREDHAKACEKCGPSRPPCGWKSICQESPEAESDTSRRLPERLAKVGREIDEVAREVLAVEAERSGLQKYNEGNPAPGVLPATESPKATRRRMNMGRKPNQEGAAGAAEGQGRKPRAVGADLANQRYASVVKGIVKLGQTPTKGFVPDDKFKAAFVQIRKLVDDAEAKMVAERAAKAEIKEEQIKLGFC